MPINRFSTWMLIVFLCQAVPLRADARKRVGAQSPDSVKGPHVLRVENKGLLFTDNSAGVSGTDAGYSLSLGDRTLWLFGDVFLLDSSSPALNYVGGVSNCGLFVPRGSGVEPLRRYTFLTEAKTGLARPLIPNEAGEGNETRLWPIGSWYDAPHHRAYLFYMLIRSTGTGVFDFRDVGHGLASADTTEPMRLQFKRLTTPKGDRFWWQGGGTFFGAAVVANAPENDPFLYLVGYQERDGHKFGKLARVRKAQIEEPSAYEYYTGSAEAPRWSQTLADAGDVEGLTDFPSELSVAYNAYLGGYLAVHSVGLEPRVRLSLAPHPWGPYRSIGEVGTPHRLFERAFCYAGKEHPELAQQNGRVVYITFVDSQRYWLQMLKVTLQK